MQAVRVARSAHFEGNDSGGDRVEPLDDLRVVRHQQDQPDIGDVADRSGLIHHPAVQLVAIEADGEIVVNPDPGAPLPSDPTAELIMIGSTEGERLFLREFGKPA